MPFFHQKRRAALLLLCEQSHWAHGACHGERRERCWTLPCSSVPQPCRPPAGGRHAPAQPGVAAPSRLDAWRAECSISEPFCTGVSLGLDLTRPAVCRQQAQRVHAARSYCALTVAGAVLWGPKGAHTAPLVSESEPKVAAALVSSSVWPIECPPSPCCLVAADLSQLYTAQDDSLSSAWGCLASCVAAGLRHWPY